MPLQNHQQHPHKKNKMATPLDTTLLTVLLPLFVFMLIFVVIYGILSKTQILGESKSLATVAALSVAALSLFIGELTQLIKIVVPWVAFFLVGVTLFFATFLFLGRKEVHAWGLMGETTVLIVFGFIIVIGISQVFEKQVSPYGEGQEINPRSETIKIVTHPRVLSVIFILLVIAAVMRFLVDKMEPIKMD